jgi:dihydrodipicolinate synthase/N-acetylneuraminate lyase
VSALANAVPELVESVRVAVAAGGSGEEEQQRLSRLREATKAVPQRAALKALVAEVAGLPRAAVRPPQAELEPQEHATLLAEYRRAGAGFVEERIGVAGARRHTTRDKES